MNFFWFFASTHIWPKYFEKVNRSPVTFRIPFRLFRHSVIYKHQSFDSYLLFEDSSISSYKVAHLVTSLLRITTDWELVYRAVGIGFDMGGLRVFSKI